jgi:hypothetical protein
MFQYQSVEAPSAANEASRFHGFLLVGGYAPDSIRFWLTLRQS